MLFDPKCLICLSKSNIFLVDIVKMPKNQILKIKKLKRPLMPQEIIEYTFN